MINGNWAQWADEAAQHWQNALAAAAAIQQALSVQKLIEIAAVSIVCAVVTSQITIARLDERINRLQSEREIYIKKRDEQVAEIKRDVEDIRKNVERITIEQARTKR